MANMIRFEIETEASYSETEKEALLDSLVEFISDTDGDVIEGTEDLKVIDSNIAGNTQSKDEIIAEFLEKATLTTTATLATDGEVLKMVSREI